jgi:hypothetical protein
MRRSHPSEPPRPPFNSSTKLEKEVGVTSQRVPTLTLGRSRTPPSRPRAVSSGRREMDREAERQQRWGGGGGGSVRSSGGLRVPHLSNMPYNPAGPAARGSGAGTTPNSLHRQLEALSQISRSIAESLAGGGHPPPEHPSGYPPSSNNTALDDLVGPDEDRPGRGPYGSKRMSLHPAELAPSGLSPDQQLQRRAVRRGQSADVKLTSQQHHRAEMDNSRWTEDGDTGFQEESEREARGRSRTPTLYAASRLQLRSRTSDPPDTSYEGGGFQQSGPRPTPPGGEGMGRRKISEMLLERSQGGRADADEAYQGYRRAGDDSYREGFAGTEVRPRGPPLASDELTPPNRYSDGRNPGNGTQPRDGGNAPTLRKNEIERIVRRVEAHFIKRLEESRVIIDEQKAIIEELRNRKEADKAFFMKQIDALERKLRAMDSRSNHGLGVGQGEGLRADSPMSGRLSTGRTTHSETPDVGHYAMTGAGPSPALTPATGGTESADELRRQLRHEREQRMKIEEQSHHLVENHAKWMETMDQRLKQKDRMMEEIVSGVRGTPRSARARDSTRRAPSVGALPGSFSLPPAAPGGTTTTGALMVTPTPLDLNDSTPNPHQAVPFQTTDDDDGGGSAVPVPSRQYPMSTSYQQERPSARRSEGLGNSEVVWMSRESSAAPVAPASRPRPGGDDRSKGVGIGSTRASAETDLVIAETTQLLAELDAEIGEITNGDRGDIPERVERTSRQQPSASQPTSEGYGRSQMYSDASSRSTAQGLRPGEVPPIRNIPTSSSSSVRGSFPFQPRQSGVPASGGDPGLPFRNERPASAGPPPASTSGAPASIAALLDDSADAVDVFLQNIAAELDSIQREGEEYH